MKETIVYKDLEGLTAASAVDFAPVSSVVATPVVVFTIGGTAKWVKKQVKSKLDRINFATSLGDPNIPLGSHLEKLRGNRNGQYSIRVSKVGEYAFTGKMETLMK